MAERLFCSRDAYCIITMYSFSTSLQILFDEITTLLHTTYNLNKLQATVGADFTPCFLQKK